MVYCVKVLPDPLVSRKVNWIWIGFLQIFFRIFAKIFAKISSLRKIEISGAFGTFAIFLLYAKMKKAYIFIGVKTGRFRDGHKKEILNVLGGRCPAMPSNDHSFTHLWAGMGIKMGIGEWGVYLTDGQWGARVARTEKNMRALSLSAFVQVYARKYRLICLLLRTYVCR